MTRCNRVLYLFYGPDGAGKTLSAFKYATSPEKKEKEKLFISNDSYHIGAKERFETFCSIIGSEGRCLEAGAVADFRDDLEKYDEIYFDALLQDELSLSGIIASLPGSVAVRKILVLHMLMLLDNRFPNHFRESAIQPDECIVTFLDYLPQLDAGNQDIIRKGLMILAEQVPLWVADGQRVPHDFHPYGEWER